MGDTFYFSHDYTARFDEKIKALLRKHGLLGYGIYWALVEDLYMNDNKISANYEEIAYDLRTDEDVVKSVICDFNLFEVTDGFVSSKSVQKRLDKRNEKSIKATESASKRWENANAMRTHNERNAIKESKGNKSKGKEIKESKNNGAFDLFWSLYGKPIGEDECRVAFAELTQDDIVKIFQTLPVYVSLTPDIKYRKNPINYLTSKSWNDNYNPPRPKTEMVY